MSEDLEKYLREEMLKFDEQREEFLKKSLPVLEGCYVAKVENGVVTVMTPETHKRHEMWNVICKFLSTAPLENIPERFILKTETGEMQEAEAELLYRLSKIYYKPLN